MLPGSLKRMVKQQIQDLMKMECFTKSNTPTQSFRLGNKTEQEMSKDAPLR